VEVHQHRPRPAPPPEVADELTGLPNRSYWDSEVDRELARGRRRGEPLSMAMIDFDRLHAYNDRNGRETTDRLLREAARAWQGVVRETDTIARFDDDTFGVLLPDCPRFEAMAVVERLRAATPNGLTCSAGVASWDGRERAFAFVARAAGALATAKRAGRDCSIAA
jgi:diguanylate cyclase (GGDEF)-like protein